MPESALARDALSLGVLVGALCRQARFAMRAGISVAGPPSGQQLNFSLGAFESSPFVGATVSATRFSEDSDKCSR